MKNSSSDSELLGDTPSRHGHVEATEKIEEPLLRRKTIDPTCSFSYASHVSRRDPNDDFRKLRLPCVSGFWSLVALLFLSSIPAYAEWGAIEKDYLAPGLRTVSIDPESIHREGNLVTLWQLICFKCMQGIRA